MIRPAQLQDADDLGDILHDWVEATDWMPKLHSRADTRGFIASLIGATDIWLVGAPPQGFLVRSGDDIRLLYLAAPARGQGWGGSLLDLAKTNRDRLSLWTFAANAPARRFYARHGFREVETTDGLRNEEELPDVRLEWVR